MLRELSRKELVRPARQSSMEGEAEYAFWHILARDVAYNQLPRASRAARHLAAAAWIESKVPERVEDLADVLAYHYATALELARATGDPEQAAELEAPALRFLGLAGERALGLDTAAAIASFERALALTPRGHPERPAALARFGQAARHAGRPVEAAEALEEAVTALQDQGDVFAAARAMGELGMTLYSLGDSRAFAFPAEAVELLEGLPPGPELVAALSELAAVEVVRGKNESGIGYARRAAALSEELGLPRPPRALSFLGLARSELGDVEGLDDLRESIRLAVQAGLGATAGNAQQNLGVVLGWFEGPVASLQALHEAVAFATSRGLVAIAASATANTLDPLVDSGRIEEALELATAICDRLDDETVTNNVMATATRARILGLRGKASGAADSLDRLESVSRAMQSPDFAVLGLGSSALARADLGQADAAIALLDELEAGPDSRFSFNYAYLLPAFVRTALALGSRELAERLAAGVEAHTPFNEHAIVTVAAALAEARGDLQAAAEGYAAAAERWQSFGALPERAFALLGEGRCLTALGGPAEAVAALLAARALFDTLQAAPGLAETDALLQRANKLSA